MTQIELPRYKFADAPKNWISIKNQFQHLKSELEEVSTEIFYAPNEGRAKEELIDVIHSAGTLLYLLEADIEKENQKVIDKNKARGYFEKTEAGKPTKQSHL